MRVRVLCFQGKSCACVFQSLENCSGGLWPPKNGAATPRPPARFQEGGVARRRRRPACPGEVLERSRKVAAAEADSVLNGEERT